MELFSSAGVVSSKSKLYDIMKLFYIAALMISSITFFSCGVVEGDLTEQENSTDLLFEDVFPTSAIDANTILRGNVVKSWETTAFKIESVNGYQECRLDDKISLDGDGTYSYDGGTMLCGAEDNEKVRTGTWTLDVESRILTLDEGEGNEFTLYVESLVESEIVVSTSYYGLAVLGKFTSN